MSKTGISWAKPVRRKIVLGYGNEGRRQHQGEGGRASVLLVHKIRRRHRLALSTSTSKNCEVL